MTFIEKDESSNTETKFCAITKDKQGNVSIVKEWSIKKSLPKSNQKTQKNSSSSEKFNRIKSSNISTNTQNIVVKNHGSISLHSPKAYQSFCNYFADHNDNKNENKEKVSLIYYNPAEKSIEEATNKNDKLALEKKAFDEMKNDCIATAKNLNKRFAKSLGHKLVISLPPEISPKIANDELLKCAVKTMLSTENFKNHKVLFGIHEDQVNTNKHKHIHILVAYGDGKNHNLHYEKRKELISATENFKKKFAETLNETYHDIKLEYKSKEKFYGDLRKGILFEGYDEINKKIICKDINGNHRSKEFCKEAYDIAKKMNLQPGDKFDYIQTKSNRPKLHPKTKKPVYYKGQIQYLNDYSFENIQRYQDLKREFYTQVKEAKELEAFIKQRQDEQSKTNTEIKSEIKQDTERTKEEPKAEKQEEKQQEQTKEQEDKLKEELSNKELELEINKTSWQFNNHFMKIHKAYKSNEISEDEYVKKLTELQAKVKKECNYDDKSGFYFNDKDSEYIEKEIKKIKPNEPENITKSNEVKQNTNTPTIPQKPKPEKKREKDIER